VKTSLFADLSEEDKEIAEYGLKQGLLLIGGMGLAVIAGWLMGIPGQAVFFLVLCYVLRIFAGGYHATTPARCGLISAIFILICFLCIKYITLPSVLTHGLTLAGGLFIMRFAPVDTANKELDEKEEQVYGRMARRIVLAEFGIYLISALLGWEPGTRCVSVCLFLMAVNLAVGLANKKRRRRLDHDENPDL
jgi:accessory gene regulator B